MNKVKEILIISSEEVTFNFDDGTKKNMTKIDYAIKIVPDSETYVGLSVLTCYVKKDSHSIVSKYAGKSVPAEIFEKPTKNGSKYVISKINGVAV